MRWLYYALGDGEAGRQNVYDYYGAADDDFASMVAGAVCTSPAMVTDALLSFADIGADDVIFNTRTDDVDDVQRWPRSSSE